MRIVGFHKSSFTFDDGRSSEGMTMYLAQDIDPANGKGIACERVYLSYTKLNGYMPRLGDEVIVDRNQSGKARGLYVLPPAK